MFDHGSLAACRTTILGPIPYDVIIVLPRQTKAAGAAIGQLCVSVVGSGVRWGFVRRTEGREFGCRG